MLVDQARNTITWLRALRDRAASGPLTTHIHGSYGSAGSHSVVNGLPGVGIMTTEDAKYLVALYNIAPTLFDLAETANLLDTKHPIICYISGTLRCICGLNQMVTFLNTLGKASQ